MWVLPREPQPMAPTRRRSAEPGTRPKDLASRAVAMAEAAMALNLRRCMGRFMSSPALPSLLARREGPHGPHPAPGGRVVVSDEADVHEHGVEGSGAPERP